MSKFDKKLNQHSNSNSNSDLSSDSECEKINLKSSNPNTNTNTSQEKKDKKKKKKNKTKNVEKSQEQSKSTKPQSAMAKLIAERQRLIAEEEARIKALEEEEEKKRKEEEERLNEIKRKEEEERQKKLKAKHDKIEAKKLAGTYKTKSEKEKEKRNQERLEQMKKLGMINNDGRIIMNQDLIVKKVSNQTKLEFIEESCRENLSDSDQESESESELELELEYKCPIFTILGHVDVGKTSLLDNLRQTTVQAHEVGGITQQIGATLLTKDIIVKRTNQNKIKNSHYKIPGLLLVDTPGHEVFGNLRKKGVQIADIAIVIIDIVHGLEPQTIESIKLLLENKTPFLFALNKLDRLYGFNKDINYLPIQQILSSQDINTKSEFETRFRHIQTQIMELGLNCELAWNNNSISDTISIIPISAITSHGIPDLLDYIINYSQTILKKQITWNPNLDCIIMEISNVEGFGFVIDAIIKNGKLTKGDIIKVNTSNGLIITQIKNLLTVPINTDSKSVSSFIHHTTIKGSIGIKIYASGLEKSIPGTQIELGTQEEYDNYINNNKFKQIDNSNIDNLNEEYNKIELDSSGIAIYTSTYGSLEALVQFIRADVELPIPIKISQANIGNVMKKDLVKLLLSNKSESNGLESNNYSPINLCVLAFEVNIDTDAKIFAKENKITIFEDKTIYRLYTQYKEHFNKIYSEIKDNARTNTVFPCVLKIIESNVFNKKNPLVLGVEIQEGSLHIGTPLITLPSKTYIGKVVGIQVNKQDVKIGKQGQSVCIKLDNESNPNIMYGRHFTHTDILYSNLTRKSVDILKEFFKKDLTKDDIGLLMKLKKQIGF